MYGTKNKSKGRTGIRNSVRRGHPSPKIICENKITIKSEPICTVAGTEKDCLRCGKENFSMEHLKVSPAKGKQCNKCGVMGHFGSVPEGTKTTEHTEATTAVGKLGRGRTRKRRRQGRRGTIRPWHRRQRVTPVHDERQDK